WRMQPDQLHLVAGFGKIVTLPAKDVFLPFTMLAAVAGAAVAHMNRDHLDQVQLLATKLANRSPGEWRMASIDSDGCTLVKGDDSVRIAFAQSPATGAELRSSLKPLAERARAEPG